MQVFGDSGNCKVIDSGVGRKKWGKQFRIEAICALKFERSHYPKSIAGIPKTNITSISRNDQKFN